MTPCCPHDLRDYLFDELAASQIAEVRAHLKTCVSCTTELETLRSTQSALLALRDEEIPQRIGFVSDKVFEPSPVRRWFAGFWTSAARIGFVSSSLLSAALLVHAFYPRTIVHNPAQSAPAQAEIDRQIQTAVAAQVAQIQTQVEAKVQAQIQTAVAQAVADTEQRAQKRTNALLAAADKRLDMERWAYTVQLESSRYQGMIKNADMVRANLGSPAQ